MQTSEEVKDIMTSEPVTNTSPLSQHDTLVIQKGSDDNTVSSSGLSAMMSSIHSQLRDLYLQIETQGPPCYRILAFIGGTMLITISVKNLIEDTISLNFTRFIIR